MQGMFRSRINMITKLGDIIQEPTDREIRWVVDNIETIEKYILEDLLEKYVDGFNTATSKIASDIRYKKIIKVLKKAIKEKEVLDGI